MKTDELKQIIVITTIIYILIFIMLVIIGYNQNKNCNLEKYYEYPCVGATHYARLHRNNNKACKRYKKICDEEVKK